MTDKKQTLLQSIQAQEEKINQLKTNNAESTVIDAEVAVLNGLKQELDVFVANTTEEAKKKKSKPSKNAFTLKTPKVRDKEQKLCPQRP